MLKTAIKLLNRNPPQKAHALLRQEFEDDFLATVNDLHNLQRRMWTLERAGSGATQAMLAAVAKAGMRTSRALDPDTGELELVMLTEPMAIVLAQKFAGAILIDCTYKTNKYNFPMLHVVSRSSTGATFTFAFAFMKQETTVYYAKALDMLLDLVPGLRTTAKVVVTDADAALNAALKQVVPEWKHLLCLWHINQNIKANCRKGLSKEEWEVFQDYWSQGVYAGTRSEYEDALTNFSKEFEGDDTFGALWTYSTSRLKDKKKFVSFYTKRHLHLGNTSTSRVEGAHRQLMRELRTARADLYRVVQILRTAMNNQQHHVLEELNLQRVRVPIVSRTLLGHVSLPLVC